MYIYTAYLRVVQNHRQEPKNLVYDFVEPTKAKTSIDELPQISLLNLTVPRKPISPRSLLLILVFIRFVQPFVPVV